MSARLLLTFIFASCLHVLSGQTRDSVYYELPESRISTITLESMMRLTTSEGNIGRTQLDQQPSYSLLPAINTVPGVRMEERSPGSYRLSIRGSLLRSPFGVRNVKIYLGNLPFTDAGGNTYLNSLDVANTGSLRLLKGPEGSIFGANTGGVLLIEPMLKSYDSIRIAGSVSGGSYGLFHENVSLQKTNKKSSYYITQGYQRTNGYRENSAMQRMYFQTGGDWDYSLKAKLKALLLYSDLYYQTPGGLTLSQYNNNPRMARPATATMPGAAEQKTAIYNRTVFTGVTHDVYYTNTFRHVFSVFASHSELENPFITNYEEREETTYGLRTYIDFNIKKTSRLNMKGNLGGEFQQTNSLIQNFGNNHGVRDTMQVSDNIKAKQGFIFAKFLTDIGQRILVEASASFNFFKYKYRNNYPYDDAGYSNRGFTPQLMPRMAISYKLTPHVSWRASASVGYSSPTIAEVRSSNNIINTELEAEKGVNLETGFRFRDTKDYLWVDISGFYYTLSNAIVRRIDSKGNEYFINAGGTKQPGLEAQASFWVKKPTKAGFIRSLQVKGNITYNHFSFSDYQIGSVDYSGHKLTGVPDYTSVESIAIGLPSFISLYLQYYYSDRIPLNDANTMYAKAYHLMQLKAEWKAKVNKVRLGVYGGIDNILNQKYSLGNDLNAMGGRYYNAAAPRNYYIGIRAEF